MENQKIKAVLCDFDNTLFETDVTMPFRKAKPKPDWATAYAKIPDCPLYNGWQAVFQELNNSGVPLGIVSGNTKGFIGRTLKYYKLEFNPIVGGYICRRRQPKTTLFPIALQHEAFKELNKCEIIYLGDQATDVELANEFGFRSGACYWGTQEPDKLDETNPTYRFYQPTDLLEIL